MDLSKTNVLKRPFGIGGTDIAAIVGLSAYKTLAFPQTSRHFS